MIDARAKLFVVGIAEEGSRQEKLEDIELIFGELEAAITKLEENITKLCS